MAFLKQCGHVLEFNTESPYRYASDLLQFGQSNGTNFLWILQIMQNKNICEPNSSKIRYPVNISHKDNVVNRIAWTVNREINVTVIHL